MRVIHLLVIGMLIFAAAYVYRIKMESTARVERVLRLNAEIREQRDAIATLRAEWAKLDAPLRRGRRTGPRRGRARPRRRPPGPPRGGRAAAGARPRLEGQVGNSLRFF